MEDSCANFERPVTFLQVGDPSLPSPLLGGERSRGASVPSASPQVALPVEVQTLGRQQAQGYWYTHWSIGYSTLG